MKRLIFLIILILMLFTMGQVYASTYRDSHITLPSVNNAHFQPRRGELVEILLRQDGMLYINWGERVDDWSKLTDVIETAMKDRQPAKQKILLYADRQTPYMYIQRVLKAAKKAGVKTVGLVTIQHASLLHFIKPRK